MNKIDIAAAHTNEAVKASLMQSHGVNDVMFISCKQKYQIKDKV